MILNHRFKGHDTFLISYNLIMSFHTFGSVQRYVLFLSFGFEQLYKYTTNTTHLLLTTYALSCLLVTCSITRANGFCNHLLTQYKTRERGKKRISRVQNNTSELEPRFASVEKKSDVLCGNGFVGDLHLGNL